MSNEAQPASGVVDTYFEKKPEENKPHKLIIGQNAFSTFDDETVADVEEGVEVAFEFVTNGRYNNIVDGSLKVKDDDPEPDTETDGATAAGRESPTDVRIRRQVALKTAVAFHKQDAAATPADVTGTAETFNEWLRGGEA